MIEPLTIPDKSKGDKLFAEEVDAIVAKVNEIAQKAAEKTEALTFSTQPFEI